MKAEEMFKDIGYKKQDSFESICYVYENEDTADFEIIFDLKNKTIHTHGACSDKSISMDELEAIYKQCQELDWVDEKICTNFTDPTSDYFICSNCGCKIVDYDHFAKKAKYKVTQFEFDLLNTYRLCKEECKFRDCTQLRQLKEKGYYKDIDANAKIRDILWNCGVIKDGNC